MIIAFYGLDGSGKSTQAQMLAERLSGRAKQVRLCNPFKNGELSNRLVDHPGDKSLSYEDYWGGKIVGTLLLEDVWDNAMHCLKGPGQITIFDRYYLDFSVFSPILGSDLAFQQPILDAFPKADISFFIDESPLVCDGRIKQRHKQSGIYVCKRETVAALWKARDAFAHLSESTADFYVIQASGRSAEVIAEEIWNITKQYL